MNSRRVLAGTEGCSSRTYIWLARPEIGAKSATGMRADGFWAPFPTERDAWTEVVIPITELERHIMGQRLPGRALVLDGRQHEPLARDVLVALLLGQLVGHVQQPAQVVREMHVAWRAPDRRQPVERLQQLRAQLVDVDAGLVEQRLHPLDQRQLAAFQAPALLRWGEVLPHWLIRGWAGWLLPDTEDQGGFLFLFL